MIRERTTEDYLAMPRRKAAAEMKQLARRYFVWSYILATVFVVSLTAAIWHAVGGNPAAGFTLALVAVASSLLAAYSYSSAYTWKQCEVAWIRAAEAEEEYGRILKQYEKFVAEWEQTNG